MARKSTSVYNSDNFTGRVNFAASYISGGENTSRTFDTCFEMGDGDAVVVALYRRTLKRPDTKLARNLFNYVNRDTVMREVERLKGEKDLVEIAARMRDGSFWKQAA